MNRLVSRPAARRLLLRLRLDLLQSMRPRVCRPQTLPFLKSMSSQERLLGPVVHRLLGPGTTTDGCPTAGLAVVAPNFTNSKFIVASMDWDISTKDQIRGRYIYNSVIGIDNSANLPAFFLPQPNKFHLVTINEYHTFTPTLTNEIRLGYNRFAQTFSAGNFTFPGLDSFPNLALQLT